MERKNKGFTVVELLVAIAIVALMIGILLPALTYVRNTAKETVQKAQLNTIEMALTAFKNDNGDYPPSYWTYTSPYNNYCGAQKLAEALLGWDLLGFHPKSAWRADGFDEYDGPLTYDPCGVRGDASLHERKGRYLELASANAFTLRQLFGNPSVQLDLDRFVLCDVFSVKKITIVNPADPTKSTTYNAGTPILYYRANTSSKTISDMTTTSNNIYNIQDNGPLVGLGRIVDQKVHEIDITKAGKVDPSIPYFYEYIRDPKVAAPAWPYRPDSYILISAGVDGLYGTKDDITNF